MVDAVTVAVTGAAGQIGYALVFRIASGQLLGADTPVALRLLEIPPAMDAVKGVIMEVQDCAFPLLAGITASDDPNVAFRRRRHRRPGRRQAAHGGNGTRRPA